jgi:hypothetical protein
VKRNRNPRYLKQYRDTAGNWINQYRRGGKLIRLPNGRDFDDRFWNGPQGYYEAECQFLAGEVREIGQTRTRPNSIDAALVGFYKSTGFRNYAAGSQRAIRQSLERDFRPVVGNAPLRHLRPKHILDLLAEQTLPGARLLMTALRAFLRYCVEVELIDRDPTAGIKLPKVKTDGFHTWFEEEIAQYRKAQAVDTTARIALELHLNTIQRTSDVIRMGWQHVRDGMIQITAKDRCGGVDPNPARPSGHPRSVAKDQPDLSRQRARNPVHAWL